VFSDNRSAYCGQTGCRACSATALLSRNEEGEDFAIKTRTVGGRVSSEVCEIKGITLGTEVTLQCFEEKHVESHGHLL